MFKETMYKQKIEYKNNHLSKLNEESTRDKLNGMKTPAGKDSKINGYIKEKSKDALKDGKDVILPNGLMQQIADKKTYKTQKSLRSSSFSSTCLPPLSLAYVQEGLAWKEMAVFRERWSGGQAVLFTDCYVDSDLWNPDNLSLEYGHLKMDLFEQPSGQILKCQSMEKYWNAFVSASNTGNNAVGGVSRHRSSNQHVSHRLKEWIFPDATDRLEFGTYF